MKLMQIEGNRFDNTLSSNCITKHFSTTVHQTIPQDQSLHISAGIVSYLIPPVPRPGYHGDGKSLSCHRWSSLSICSTFTAYCCLHGYGVIIGLGTGRLLELAYLKSFIFLEEKMYLAFYPKKNIASCKTENHIYISIPEDFFKKNILLTKTTVF